MTDSELLQKIFNTCDEFAHHGTIRNALTVPELAKRMETYRIQFYGKSREVPHEFHDDVK